MRTNPSTSNLLDSAASASSYDAQTAHQMQTFAMNPQNSPLYTTQAARMNPSFSTSDVAALAASGHGTSSARDGYGGSATGSGRSMRSPSMVFDGMEPKIFPGVVAKRRRSSVARSGSFTLNDGAIGPVPGQGIRKAETIAGEVIPESGKSGTGTPKEDAQQEEKP